MKKETLNGVIAGGVVLALALGAYLVFKKKPVIPDDGVKPDDGTTPLQPSTNSLDYSQMADNLFNAMNGYGTGNTTIEEELKKLKSKSDWNNLVNAFGIRKISSGFGNIFQGDFTGNLPECLNDELDQDELKSANKILNKIGVSI